MYKFNKSLDWLKESEENELSIDELDQTIGDEEQVNEVRYIDPKNVDKYDPSEIEEVTTASGEKKYKRKSNGGNQPAKKQEPASYGEKVNYGDIREGNTYLSKEDIAYGFVDDVDEETAAELKKAGMVDKDGNITIPAGTDMKYQGAQGGADVFEVNGIQLDMDGSSMDLYGSTKDNIEPGFNKDFANDIKNKYGADKYQKMIDIANQYDSELYPTSTAKYIKDDTGMDEKDIEKFVKMYKYSDKDTWQNN